jgi:hypothetical protein
MPTMGASEAAAFKHTLMGGCIHCTLHTLHFARTTTSIVIAHATWYSIAYTLAHSSTAPPILHPSSTHPPSTLHLSRYRWGCNLRRGCWTADPPP